MKQDRQQTGKHGPERDWAQRLRDHLADYEVPVPDDLWEKIEARLPKEIVSPTPTPKKKKARIVPLWARWAAAAAVFVGGLVILWKVEGGMWRSAEGRLLPEGRKNENRYEADQTTPPKGTPPNLGGESCAQGKITPKETISSDEKTEKESAEKPIQPIQSILSEEKPILPIQPILSEEKPKESEKHPEDVIRELDRKIMEYEQRRSHKASLNLYASNGFGNQSFRNGVLMSPELLANYDYYTNPSSVGTRGDNSPVYLANHEERQQFYQPISFGLSVNIPISSGFSVSSGIVYTRLRSDFTSIANSLVYERQQTLHYVGIPLTVQYNVWQWHGLNVYATAGGQVDFNVKANVTTEGSETTLEKDDLQWSVNAAVGVQYNFIPQLGIYAEPGIKHYFDNGSHIQNFFKHRPTNFNLQIGLRLNMGK